MADIQKKIRLFAAIDAPSSFHALIVDVQQAIKKRSLIEGTYVDSQHLHVTLAFIGDVDESAVGDIDAALKTVRFQRFEAITDRMSLFGAHGRAQVAYLALESPDMGLLERQIQAALAPWCKSPEKRASVPHVTFARVKKTYGYAKLQQFLDDYEVPSISWPIRSFTLQSSTLTPTGAKHQILREYMAD